MFTKHKKNATRLAQMIFVLSALLLLSSCSVINVQKGVSLSAENAWIILPFQNNSQTPRAGNQAEKIVMTLLRIRGVTNLAPYSPPPSESNNEWPELNDHQSQEKTILRSLKNKYAYAISGSIDEWQYKLGVGNEPAVGLTLHIIEISTGKVIWSGSGARSGWNMESLNGVAQKLIDNLLSNIEIITI